MKHKQREIITNHFGELIVWEPMILFANHFITCGKQMKELPLEVTYAVKINGFLLRNIDQREIITIQHCVL